LKTEKYVSEPCVTMFSTSNAGWTHGPNIDDVDALTAKDLPRLKDVLNISPTSGSRHILRTINKRSLTMKRTIKQTS